MKSVSTEGLVNISIIFLGACALTVALIFTKSVLLPFVFSLFIFTCISPLVGVLQLKFKAPKTIAISLSFLMVLLALSLIAVLVVDSISEFSQGAVLYKSKISSFIGRTQDILGGLGFHFDMEGLRNELENLPILQWAKGLSGGLMAFIGNLFLVVVFSLFLLFGDSSSSNKSTLVMELQAKIFKYVTTKLVVSAATGLLVGLILFLFEVEMAFMFALFAFLLNFIPSIGSIVATLLPIPIVLLQFNFGWQFITILVLTSAIQVTVGNVIEPKVMGEFMHLHPITILLFLIFWGLVWGVPGMFLAVPITAIMRLIMSRIDATKPLSRLMAGQI